jgi:hypothetical protein
MSSTGTRLRRKSVQSRARASGIRLATTTAVLSFFMAGAEMVRWELTAVESEGPYRLTVRHSQGVIVEYFTTSAAALLRQQEIEDLLIAARGLLAS